MKWTLVREELEISFITMFLNLSKRCLEWSTAASGSLCISRSVRRVGTRSDWELLAAMRRGSTNMSQCLHKTSEDCWGRLTDLKKTLLIRSRVLSTHRQLLALSYGQSGTASLLATLCLNQEYPTQIIWWAKKNCWKNWALYKKIKLRTQ